MRRVSFVLPSVLAPASLLRAQAPGAPAEGPPRQPLPHPELPEVPELPVEAPWWFWAALAVLLLGLLGLVFWLLFSRPGRRRTLAPIRPRKDAIEALRKLRMDAPTLAPAAIAAQVSAILRRYFEARYQIPAPYRTSPELFEEAAAPPAPKPVADSKVTFVPKKTLSPPRSPLQPFAPLAKLWDRLAFAPVPATVDEALRLIDTAREHIQQDPA